MHVFYIDDLKEGVNMLNTGESRHCSRVLRMHKGEKAYFLDGKGTFASGIITYPDPKQTRVDIMELERDHGKRPYSLHIAIAPTKNTDRFEWFLEKCMEIGIDEISPILCERSERKILKTERPRKRILSAMKQSMNTFMPRLNEMTKFEDLISSIPSGTNAYIAHLGENKPPLLKDRDLYHANSLIIIGPEGDFTPAELEKAFNKNITQVSLGSSRLRTETAGLVSCHTVSLANQ